MVYLGRIVGLGKNENGNHFVVYGVSGRSEASRLRKAVVYDDRVAIEPLGEMTPEQREQAALLTYNAIKVFNGGPYAKRSREQPFAIVSNGRHTDAAFDKWLNGNLYPSGAISKALEEFGPEPDSYHTPRIIAMNMLGDPSLFGVISADREYPEIIGYAEHDVLARLHPDQTLILSTYVGGTPEPQAIARSNGTPLKSVLLSKETSQTLADSMFDFIDPELVVCAAAALWSPQEKKWQLAKKNLRE